MPRPLRLVVAIVALPFLTGCYTVAQVPVPAVPQEREQLDVRGVTVVRAGGTEETVRFDEVLDADWTPTSLSIVGVRRDTAGQRQDVTLLFQLSEISDLWVRQLDAGKTSGIVGGVIVGAIAVIALVVTGSQCDGPTPLPGC